jgi:hypothetical protein
MKKILVEIRIRIKMYLEQMYLEPLLCRFDMHHSFVDIIDHDGAIRRGMCMCCLKDTAPKRPQPPDPEFSAYLDEMRAAAIAYLESDDAEASE